MALLDCVRRDDRTSLIFEFVEGRDFVKDLPNFTERDVARYMRELFIALAHVHRSGSVAAPCSTIHTRSGLKSYTVMSNLTTSCISPSQRFVWGSIYHAATGIISTSTEGCSG